MTEMIEHSSVHANGEFHHNHSHAHSSKHPHSHHLLQVEGLSVSFRMYEDSQRGIVGFFKAKQRDVEVIHDLSISVHEGEVIAVVGASGSGKTLLADSILGMFEPNAKVSGAIWFDGVEQTAQTLQALRGREIAFVPQSSEALDPLMRVGRQVRGLNGSKERQEALFERYGLALEVARMYPHELSGGMARRVLLCCALMGSPRLLVADEPTPGLDQGLAETALADLRAFANEGGGVLLITHDIDLALRFADRIAVFKDGTVVEETDVASFSDPSRLRHPFTRQLWHAMPENMLRNGEVLGEHASREASSADAASVAVAAVTAAAAAAAATPEGTAGDATEKGPDGAHEAKVGAFDA